jgi:putative ABC transport system permease protein
MATLIFRKIWGDLAHNKARTLLAVLSIAAGVFALGLAFGALGVMRARIEQDKLASRPTDLTFRAWALGQETFHQDLVDAALRRPGVADAEGETTLPLRWQLEGEKNWQNGTLVARADYVAQRISLVQLLEGQWPARHTLAVERKSSQYFAVPLGATILVESGQGERQLPVVGVVRKP